MRRRLLVLTAALWGAMVIPAQAAPVPVGGRIAGPDGKPVRGARVELVPVPSRFAAGELQLQGQNGPEPAARTASREDGRFEIAAPAPGMWELHVAAPGSVTLSVSLVPLLEPRELPPLQLTPEMAVRLRVADPQGRPVAGAHVVADVPWAAGEPVTPRRQLATTGADGTAVLPLAKGQARVRVAAAGHPVTALQVSTREPAAELRLAAGCPRTVQVTAGSGGGAKPVEGALVSHDGWPLGITGATGRLTVAAPCGRDLRLAVETRDGRRAKATLPHGSQGGTAEAPPLAVALPSQPVRVSGRVQEEGANTAVPGALVWSAADPAAFARTNAKGAYTVTLTGGDEDERLLADAAGYLAGSQPARAGAAGPTFSLKAVDGVSGMVVDEAGRPVADAEVESVATEPDELAPSQPGFARTDSQGRFRLRSPAGAAFTLTARHPDFVSGKLSVPAAAPRAPRSGLRIVLARGLSVTGKVTDTAGTPIAGAEVWLAPSGRDRAARDRPRASGVTDDQGRFTLEHLAPGRVELTAAASGFAPTRVPGLELTAGPEIQDLGTVTLAPGVALHGVVVDPRDEPIAGARVIARGVSGFIPRGWGPTGEVETQTAEDGTFSIPDLSPGARVTLNVLSRGYTRTEFRSLELTPEPLRIVLSPAAEIAGRVVDETGDPVPDAAVSLFRIGAELVEGVPGSRDEAGRGLTGPDGGFAISGVTAGKVRLVIRHRDFQDGEIPVLEVVAGRDIENLEVVLRRGAAVTGRVLGPDGRPVAGAAVAPVQGSGDAPPQPGFRGARADAEGQYRIQGVPDGLHSFEARGPGLQPLVRELRVRPGENRLDFHLAAGHEVSGRVLDAAGAPVAGAQVRLVQPGTPLLTGRSGAGRESTPTGADGSFRLDGAATGVYDVQVGKEGYAPGRLAGLEVAGRVQDLEIRLAAAGSIQGRLTGLELADLSSVTLYATPVRPEGRVIPSQGETDFQGSYRINGLAAGEWGVAASLPDGRRATGRVTVAPGESAVLDLDFTAGGLTLTGRLLRRGEPVPDVTVMLAGTGSRHFGQTDPQGSFRIRGLAAGSYTLGTLLPGGRVEPRGTVELSRDRDILVEISGSQVSGRVVDATDQSPIARATVSLEPAASGPSRGAGSDENGAFTFTDVAPGTYRLQGRVDGYALTETLVEVGESGVDGALLALQPTAGLTLEVRGSLGSPPPQVRIALLDAAGRAVLTESHATGENGRVRLTSAPPGRWRLVVTANGYATVEQTVQVPGPTVHVTLPAPSS